MQHSKEIEKYLTDHRSFEGNGAGNAPSWLKELRSNALGRFAEQGFPTVKQEDWRFTNILPLTKTAFGYSSTKGLPALTKNDVAKFVIKEAAKSVLVFLNGRFQKSLSDLSALPKEIVAGSLSECLARDGEIFRQNLNKYISLQAHPFAALNTAFVNDGAFVHVRKGVTASAPIQLLFISTNVNGEPIASYPRNLILVDESASATVVEEFVSLSDEVNFTNVVTEIAVGQKAAFDYIKIQRESEKAFHVGTMQVQQQGQSRFTAFSLALGGAIARNDINITIDGEECQTMLDGLYVPSNDQLIDHHTFMDHRKPNCSSREIFKGIVSGNSRSVFNGKIFVQKEAQKTDSKQTNRNLLLSDKATVDTKPQLEIFADDVKCTHGATVGGLDQSSLFYAKSRAISEEASRALLTLGFASEVTDYINDADLRKHVDSLVVERLQKTVVKAVLPEIVHSDIKAL